MWISYVFSNRKNGKFNNNKAIVSKRFGSANMSHCLSCNENIKQGNFDKRKVKNVKEKATRQRWRKLRRSKLKLLVSWFLSFQILTFRVIVKIDILKPTFVIGVVV